MACWHCSKALLLTGMGREQSGVFSLGGLIFTGALWHTLPKKDVAIIFIFMVSGHVIPNTVTKNSIYHPGLFLLTSITNVTFIMIYS